MPQTVRVAPAALRAARPDPGVFPAPFRRREQGGLRRLLRTHAVRLAALYLLVFAVSVIGVLAFVYWTSAGFVERQTEATLDAELTGLAEQYAQRGLSGLVQIVSARSVGERADAMLYLVTDSEAKPLAGNIAEWPQGIAPRRGWISFSVEAHTRDGIVIHPALGNAFLLPGGFRLLVGRDLNDAETFRARLRTALLWAGLMALALGIGGGALMSRNMLRRVEAVNRTSERVMGGDLAERVPLSGSGDEFDQLAGNLNKMLNRIERLMTAMREVTDNVAHDLKTPLGRLRARLEMALIEPRDGSSAHQVLPMADAVRGAIDEADRLLATFNALLSIAEVESGAGSAAAAPVDLGDLVRAAVELYEPVAEEKGFAMRSEIQPGLTISGDRHLLSQALANVLDNVLKYAPGGEILLSARREGGEAVVEIADCGPGIPATDRDIVFDRFVRLERSRSTPGNGLGLALVRAVAQRFGGSATLADNRPGLRVRLALPLLK